MIGTTAVMLVVVVWVVAVIAMTLFAILNREEY